MVWERSFGSPILSSSPQAIDLNGDGTLDLVIGGGEESKAGLLLAVDGATGDALWTRPFRDEVFTTSVALDINGDRVPDVFAGGRKLNNDLVALNGRTGETIWTLHSANPEMRLPPLGALLNRADAGTGTDDRGRAGKGRALPDPGPHQYNSPAVVPADLDGDGVRELVAVRGGGHDLTRPASRVFLISGRTGKVIRSRTTPDGKECYTAPTVFRARPGDPWRVLIGTGGETIAGALHALNLADLGVAWQCPSVHNGFVAVPALCDPDGDGVLDIAAASIGGGVYRIDAATGGVRWKHVFPGAGQASYQCYSTPGPGRFNPDSTLDFATAFSLGSYPRYAESLLIWVDGASGALIHAAPAGRFVMSSPVTADLDGDGYHEVFLMANFPRTPAQEADVFEESYSRLLVFDGGRDKRLLHEIPFDGFSASTPLLADLDADGLLDLVIAHSGAFLRIALPYPTAAGALGWSRFRGANGDGILR